LLRRRCSRTCYCNSWSVKSILFQGSTAEDFKCRTVAGQATSSGGEEEACLSHQNEHNQNVANTDDLDEYYEYTTGVPSEWGGEDTIWLESVEEHGASSEVLTLEPPLQLTLQVPCDEPTQSISGVDYACKKIVVTFSDGIDMWNSPGFPLWCLNKESGNTRAPISDSNGQQQCVDWDKYNADQENFDWSTEYYEMYPDINPDLNWEGWDGKNLKWGLKPAEKTIVYTQIPDESCTHDFENPVTLDDSWNIEQVLEEPTATMRTKLEDLFKWYLANQDAEDALRVHTGKIIERATVKVEAE